jgi:alpha-galactosidase
MIRTFLPLFFALALPLAAQISIPAPLDFAAHWRPAGFFTAADQPPPFSFKYGGKPWADLLSTWQVQRNEGALDPNRTRQTIIYTDPETGLEVHCVGTQYHDFPAMEWTVFFKNTGHADTPLIEDVQAIDTTFPVDATASSPQLRYFNGGQAADDDYRPLVSPLGTPQSFTPNGRGSDRWLPYFNFDSGNTGVILAVGWPGQWKLDVAGDAQNGWKVRSGLELTHFVLHPGESVRGPLIALLFWQGADWIDGQNVWRRWMIAHNMPTQRNGKPLAPQFVACSSHQTGEMVNANEENQKQFIDGYLDNGIKLDYWWMDAGWYVNDGQWQNTGTWEVDTKRFPNGLRAISDYAHNKGVKTIVWFEPERVTDGSWLATNHPEWLLGKPGGNRLLNLGNAAALAWITTHISQMITDQGIDLYRQDFNMNPLGYWRANDTPDRQGITEMQDVTGYLAFWDGLRARHPGLLIDSCASGGRRNDLETMRRSVPLLRSDDIMTPIPQEGHTYGLSFWIPYQGTGVDSDNAFTFRSCTPWNVIACYDTRRKDLNYPAIKKLYDQWRETSPEFLKDYYPLTPYTIADTDWIAWQFNDPEAQSGIIQAFRRPKNTGDTLAVKLRGLDPLATYELTDIDTAKARRVSGLKLMQEGYQIVSPDLSGAPLIQYKKVAR